MALYAVPARKSNREEAKWTHTPIRNIISFIDAAIGAKRTIWESANYPDWNSKAIKHNKRAKLKSTA